MELTRYEKELARIVAQKYGKRSAAGIVEVLCRAGVIDHSLCKVLAIRRWVGAEMDRGTGKVRAMWLPPEYFCVSYE